MFKRIVSVLIAALMLMGCIPGYALTEAAPRYETPAGYNAHDYQRLVKIAGGKHGERTEHIGQNRIPRMA